MGKINDRQIILEDNGHYWIRSNMNHVEKSAMIGQYDQSRDTFSIIGSNAVFQAKHFDIISNIILRETDFNKI